MVLIKINRVKKFQINKNTLKLVLLISFFLVAFALGLFLEHLSFTNKVLKPVLKMNFRIVGNYLIGLTSKPETLTIDMKHKEFQKIAYQRERAFKESKLFARDDDFVKAVISYQGKPVKVKMRLKGDHLDHLRSKKWSYRVKVNGENTVMGMKTFSLQSPETRSFLNEWIYHEALKKENIIGLRYKFVNLIFNGKKLGIYAIEEHFDKRLIESNQLREGPIVRFNEELLWQERVQQHQPYTQNGSGAYHSSDIDSFGTTKIFADSNLFKLFKKAVTLLEAFRRGQLQTSEVFDINKLAKYFALSDLMGSHHGTIWHNLRFYYNPVTSKLEPIGFDGNSGKYIHELVFRRPYEFTKTLFEDENFFREYIKALEEVSDPKYFDNLLTSVKPEINENLKVIYSDYPLYKFAQGPFKANARYIKTVLNPVKSLQIFYDRSNNNTVTLKIGNIQSLPVEVMSLEFVDKDSTITFPIKTSQQAIIEGKKNARVQTEYQELSFSLPQDFVLSNEIIDKLKLKYKILGTSNIHEEKVFAWSSLDVLQVKDDLMRKAPNINEFPFIRVDNLAKRISVVSGAHSLTKNMIIPPGYKFEIVEGTILDLQNKSKIISYSPISFIGVAQNPIIIRSSDKTGQGMLVINANTGTKDFYLNDKTKIFPSFMSHVIFQNLSNPQEPDWSVTGAVTFYQSPVEIESCIFEANNSEDALNIFKSEFLITNSVFKDTFADAFDGDFVIGKIADSKFINLGNDAVDVSGSRIEVQNVSIKKASDKGLSSGEDSIMIIQKVSVEDSEIALASKDKSMINAKDLDISNSKVAFTVFQKKPEFGPGKIVINNLKITNVEKTYLVEDSSTVEVDGKVVSAKQAKVKDLLYGVKYGKSSKH